MFGRHVPETIQERVIRLRRQTHALSVAVQLERDNLARERSRWVWTDRQSRIREMRCEASVQRIITLSNMFDSLLRDLRDSEAHGRDVEAA